MKRIMLILFLSISAIGAFAGNGYKLWMPKHTICNSRTSEEYKQAFSKVCIPATSQVLQTAQKELTRSLQILLGERPCFTSTTDSAGLLVGTPASLPILKQVFNQEDWACLVNGGFKIVQKEIEGKRHWIITASTDEGILYGVFRLVQQMQLEKPLLNFEVTDIPKLRYRVLNHWDNLDGSIERGYAGYSLWNWERLPYLTGTRVEDYARADASLGINGVVINNVNSKAVILRKDYLVKISGLADVFRKYGIKLYLSVKFSSPMELGNLKSADPQDPEVRQWWKDKVKEIYKIIPDFGGFLVKANSEGQPGPQDYGRTHADGANMLGEALKTYGGIVFWRTFVYQNNRKVDRIASGYPEFKPLDGSFAGNVFLQVKNGPLDFQPREPFNPLFGQMPRTPLAMELQITQENLGHVGHLVYLGPLYEEVLQSDTYAQGKGSTVSRILQECQGHFGMSAIAGVANTGTDNNWTGYTFGQANWFAFGRLAWDPDRKAADIADEWIRLTISKDSDVVAKVGSIMMSSREAYVNYTMPLGLNHIMNFNTHNGPEPWHDDPLWTAYDYHKITKDSIGVDRTRKGSDAVGQYHKQVANSFNDIHTCPETYLLWFHRLPWDYKTKEGMTLWENLVRHYYKGVDEVQQIHSTWRQLKGKVDPDLYDETDSLLSYQYREACWWRDACVLFFQKYSGEKLPDGLQAPAHTLGYYEQIPFPYEWNKIE